MLVVMEGKPVDQTLMLDDTVEPGLPVATQVAVDDAEAVRTPRANGDLVAVNPCAADGDVPSAVDENGKSPRLVRQSTVGCSEQRRAGEVDRDVIAAHDDEG